MKEIFWVCGNSAPPRLALHTRYSGLLLFVVVFHCSSDYRRPHLRLTFTSRFKPSVDSPFDECVLVFLSTSFSFPRFLVERRREVVSDIPTQRIGENVRPLESGWLREWGENWVLFLFFCWGVEWNEPYLWCVLVSLSLLATHCAIRGTVKSEFSKPPKADHYPPLILWFLLSGKKSVFI